MIQSKKRLRPLLVDPPYLVSLKQVAGKFLGGESSGHDITHALRVLELARQLTRIESGNWFVVAGAALMHDIMRPWEKKHKKSHFGPEALEQIKQLLLAAGVPDQEIELILAVISRHDEYDWHGQAEPKSLDLQIVQDADNLDAAGAIGLARALVFAGAYGDPIYNPDEDLSALSSREFQESPDRQDRPSAIGHLYEKVMKLHALMNTATGKQMMSKRQQFVQQFVDQLAAEIAGER